MSEEVEKQERFIVNNAADLPKLKEFLSAREYDTIKALSDRIGNTMFGLRQLRDRFGKVFKNRGLVIVIDYDLDKDDPDVQKLLEDVQELLIAHKAAGHPPKRRLS